MYNVKIVDNIGNLIGERFDASPEEIIKYIRKGFKVIDINNHKEILIEDVIPQVGVSECAIII